MNAVAPQPGARGNSRRLALKQDPAQMMRGPTGAQFPDGLRLPVKRHADAAA